MVIIDDQAYVLVPVRMTEQMRKAAFRYSHHRFQSQWLQILRARPRVEQQVKIERQQQQGDGHA